MNQAWIGVIGTLFGVLIGGLVTNFLNSSQFKRESKLKAQQLIQQKLEEICQTAEAIHESNRHLTAECYGYMSLGELPNLDTIKFIPLSHLNMLIYFYAPDLKELSNLLRETVRLHGIAITEMFENKDPKDIQGAFQYVLTASELIDKLCLSIIHSSASIVRDHF